MARIFISYRRAASAGQAGRLHDQLANAFGSHNVFMDTEDIPAGETFESYILAEIERCDVFLLMLDHGTLDRIDVDGDNSGDWLFREIKCALDLPRVRVIPVLIDGFQMPQPETLPLEIREITQRNAVVLVHQAFSATSENIIQRIREVIPGLSNRGCLQTVWNLGGNVNLVGWATILSLLVAISGITIVSLLNSSDGEKKPTAQVEVPTNTPIATLTDIPEPTSTQTTTRTPRPTDIATPTMNPTNTPTPNSPHMLTPSMSVSTPASSQDLMLTALERAQNFSGSNQDWAEFVWEFDSVQMVLVPSGCFEMGSENGAADERPVNEVCFDEPFWIDRYEVTNGQFSQFNGQSSVKSYISGDEFPREQITWFEAQKFCELRGTRLPTEAEWEYAARGPDGLEYPWGNTFSCELGNFDDESEVDSYTVGEKGCDGFSEISPVTSFPNGKSWVGALNMSGNVWEWTGTLKFDYPYDLNDGRENRNDISYARVIRGGSFYDILSDLRASARTGYDPSNRFNNFGFRCVFPMNPPISIDDIPYGTENWNIGDSVIFLARLDLCRHPDVTTCDAGVVDSGDSGIIIIGPFGSGEHWWWKIELTDGRKGWVAQVLLSKE